MSNPALLQSFRALRRKAESPGFNVKLLDNIVIATTLAAYVSFLICQRTNVSQIGWFSDRDNITASYGAIASEFYAVNVAGYCRSYLNGWCGPHLGVNAQTEPAAPLWSDPFTRVPDHFAGAISAWDLESNTLTESSPKYLEVIDNGIASRPNVCLIRLAFESVNESIAVSAAKIQVFRK